MSLQPEKRKCFICGRIYNFNPNVGKILCPYCKTDKNKHLTLKQKGEKQSE